MEHSNESSLILWNCIHLKVNIRYTMWWLLRKNVKKSKRGVKKRETEKKQKKKRVEMNREEMNLCANVSFHVIYIEMIFDDISLSLCETLKVTMVYLVSLRIGACCVYANVCECVRLFIFYFFIFFSFSYWQTKQLVCMPASILVIFE